MSDLIDRQAAIDAVTDELDMIDHVPQWVFNRLEKRLKQLPLAQPEPCEDAVSRTEILRMINCINDHHAITPYKSVGAVTEHLTRIARSLPHVTPKQRTGKWIPDRSGAYCCSECMEPCAGYVMMKPRDKFCKMCGARMTEGDTE